MAERSQLEKQKVVHLIQQVPFNDEEKTLWLKSLEQNGVTETLIDEMHEKLLSIPNEKFASDWMRAKFTTDLARFARQWRMQTASRQFKHGR
ncbi:MAG TPA: hypothetical protein PKK59_03370 [Anaerolineaceae bacterium]|nr:hypothetical protein [Anaerolineaceae bacterium]